jgi:hypothetical protein
LTLRETVNRAQAELLRYLEQGTLIRIKFEMKRLRQLHRPATPLPRRPETSISWQTPLTVCAPIPQFLKAQSYPKNDVIPLPATLPLFATGLGALGLRGWRRKRKALAVA